MANNVAKIKEELKMEKFRKTLPRQIRGRVSAEVMRNINATLQDDLTKEQFRENFLGYTKELLTKPFSAYVTAYNHNKLVNAILEQHYFQAKPSVECYLYQKATNTQAEFMISAKSEKVRTDAANSLLNHLIPHFNIREPLKLPPQSPNLKAL